MLFPKEWKESYSLDEERRDGLAGTAPRGEAVEDDGLMFLEDLVELLLTAEKKTDC
jgi:hypothetical protein